ncbi:MAG: arginine--tRNA ligase [Candidatus Sungbacteria bacterium]|nr:arginine--tRNA ligase [Candidatus Sungbacteria bacterium]
MREKLRNILKKIAGIGDDIQFSLSEPPRPEYGDYATNLPLVLAKDRKENPMKLAAALKGKLLDDLIEKVEVAAPGFLNITLTSKAKESAFHEILGSGENYGNQRTSSEKIQVEFISANPTGPLTLANGRGGFFGDVLSKVLETRGYEVEREYYINDAGNQVRTLGLAILASTGLVPDSEEYYRGEHISEWAGEHKDECVTLKDDPEALGKKVAADFLRTMIQPAVEEKMKIKFDRWTSEDTNLHKAGYVGRFLELAKSNGLVYENENAQWLKTTDFGDDKDRVLVTSDGFLTYLLADGGHYLETKERGFDRKILILGADHHGYIGRIQAVAQIVGLLKSEVVIMQLVRLMEGGVERRMSKRKGVYVTIDELIDEVGLDAVRYFFLEKNPETHIDFDIALAKKHSKENPVYYVQYAHARIASIFRKGAVMPDKFDFSLLSSDSEKTLISKLVRFPEILEDIAGDYRISRLVHYVYELANAFHVFYEKNRILDAEDNIKEARTSLAVATQIVLKRALWLLGMSAPEEM